MAAYTDIDERELEAWITTVPPDIAAIVRAKPPNLLYRLKPGEQRVTLVSYDSNGTVTVAVTGEYNLVGFNRQVFGIDPNDLEECDLPEPHEVLGTILSPDEVTAALDGVQGVEDRQRAIRDAAERKIKSGAPLYVHP